MYPFGYWATLCPLCRRWARVGDGPEGLLSGHAMNIPSYWAGIPYIPCVVKDIDISEARALADQLSGRMTIE